MNLFMAFVVFVIYLELKAKKKQAQVLLPWVSLGIVVVAGVIAGAPS